MSLMPDTQIRPLPIAALAPWARNARTHSKKQIRQIAASIRQFGFTNPVLIDEAGTILAGHGRVAAAELLGMTEVPCLRVDHMSEDEKRAYVLADNQLRAQCRLGRGPARRRAGCAAVRGPRLRHRDHRLLDP